MQVIKFKVKLKMALTKIWRNIELSSEDNLGTLMCAIMEAFNTTDYHLILATINGDEYTYVDEPYYKDPVSAILKNFNFEKGEKFDVVYDFGVEWNFVVSVAAIKDVDDGDKDKYPCITGGKGNGILEDVDPYHFVELIAATDKLDRGLTFDEIDMIQNYDEYDEYDEDDEDDEDEDECSEDKDEYDEEDLWDYRVFDLKESNKNFQERINSLKMFYNNN